jgi:PTS system fructose-specific IIA component/PTS system nitrogen regulatory IIA component
MGVVLGDVDVSGALRGPPFRSFGRVQRADDLGDVVVIEPDGHPARGEKDGHAVADNQRSGVIDLKPLPAVQFDCEDAERLKAFQPLKNPIKILGSHSVIFSSSAREGTVDDLDVAFERRAMSLGFVSTIFPESIRSAESAVRYLVGQLVAQEMLAAEDAESAVQAALNRDLLGSTRVGRRFALPRGVVSSLKHVIGAVGRSTAGVPWDSESNTPVFVVCLVLAPPSRPGDHMRALKQMSDAAE